MPTSRIDQLLIAAGGCLLLVLGLIAWLLVTGSSARPELAGGEPQLVAGTLAPGASVALAGVAPAGGSTVVVDVQGAVQRPGVYELAAGSRVGDAIAAAGGYDSTVDTEAAAATLNLASPLTDAQKILVPDMATAAEVNGTGGGGGGGGETGEGTGTAPSGPLNLNTATAAELEELPGIGPVTAEKIIAARREQPFTSLEELVDRDVLNRGQLEDIQDLAVAS